MKTLILTCFLGSILAKNHVVSKNNLPYTLEDPELKIELPSILHEISGITDIDANTVACVQDEKGIIFIYDLISKRITNQFDFGEDGDYEGITRVNNTIYILRSDGDLIEVDGFKDKKLKTTIYNLKMPSKNNEGLCYDAANNRLLIGGKSKPGKGAEFVDKRMIYGFSLRTKTRSENPVYTFSISEIKVFALQHNIELPTKMNKKTRQLKTHLFMGISAISIHPITHELYVLSAVDYTLFIFDITGKLKHIETLDKKQFLQAEGITFQPNGDLLISNEGQDKKPVLYQYRFQPK